jgi:L-rhamnose mutarotase
VFSNEIIEYDNPENFLFYVFYNSGLDEKIKKMTEQELLNKDWNFTKYIKKSLN